jgi:hypothetical protein
VEDIVADGDMVAIRGTASGTHEGEFFGHPPTGKRFSAEQVHWFRLADAKVVQHWAVRDDLGQMQQLGLLPEPGTARLSVELRYYSPNGVEGRFRELRMHDLPYSAPEGREDGQIAHPRRVSRVLLVVVLHKDSRTWITRIRVHIQYITVIIHNGQGRPISRILL